MSDKTVHSDRVADAPSDNFVYRMLPRWLWPYAQLARWDRPIGWQLLMWPCLWSAALAANVPGAAEAGYGMGMFVWHSILFFVGAVAMRGAGCTYNDLVDIDIDNEVARTRSRPLPSGRVTPLQAKAFIAAQALAGLLVLVQFNLFTIVLGLLSLVFVAIYPFAKRFTDWPQLFLGLAFSWGALMGWAAAFRGLDGAAFLLYAGSILWVIGYDTIYAHQDKEDDAIVGVRSTALLFGSDTKTWLGGIYCGAVVLMASAFALADASFPAFIGLAAAALHFAYQIVRLDIDDAGQCLKLFKSNSFAGAIVFAGLALGAFAAAMTALPPVY